MLLSAAVGFAGLKVPPHGVVDSSSSSSSVSSGAGSGRGGGRALLRPFMRRATASPQCCICINCKLIDRCKLYHWVETMHEQPHVTDAPTFDPADPQIQVFLRNETSSAELSSSSSSEAEEEVRPFLSTEYDVFACDAFDEDRGKWLRLMPDAEYIPT